MRNILIVAVLLAVAGGGYWLLKGNGTPSPSPASDTPVARTPSTNEAPETPRPPAETSDPAALLALAKSRMATDCDGAAEILERVLAAQPAGPHGQEAAKLLLPIAAKSGRIRRELTLKWRLNQLDAAGWKRLEDLNTDLLSEKTESRDPDARFYTVVPGDTLGKIGAKEQTTIELIQKLNKMPGDRIKPGQRLKVLPVKGRVSVEVHKSEFSLCLLYDGNLIRRYPVGTGQGDLTPEGAFKIKTTLVDPPWYKEGQVHPIPSGDPENILGTRWLGFAEPFGRYGIHGTTKPETIGQAASNGCIRMRNADVEDLYPFCPKDTPVVISE